MKEIKKIDILSSGKVYAILSGIWGVILAIFSVAVTYIYPDPTLTETTGTLIAGALQLIVIMIVLGFLAGIIIAFFYNLIAKKLGGVKVNLE